MPIYYLHIENGETYPDRTGIDLPDIQAARQHAIKIVETMLHDQQDDGSEYRVVITDDKGRRLQTVALGKD